MATSKERQEFINDIKFPFKFYRIKVYGRGGHDFLYKLDKYGFDYWSRELQKNPSAIIDYINDARNSTGKNNLPPYADFLNDNDSRIGMEWGASFSSCDLSVTQTDGEDIGSNDVKTIIQGTPLISLSRPTIQLNKTQLPKYVLAYSSHEVGDFIELMLKIGHPFDIEHLKFGILERAKGDMVLQDLIYQNNKLETKFGPTKETNETTNIWKT